MSELVQEKVIEEMTKLSEKGQTYLFGVMAGLVAMQDAMKGGKNNAEGAPDGGAAGSGALAE